MGGEDVKELSENEAHQKEVNKKSEQVGLAARSEKIRTYNFRDNRISDHINNVKYFNMDKALYDGEIDDIIFKDYDKFQQ